MSSSLGCRKSCPSALLRSLVLGLALVLGAHAAEAQIRTVLVSPVPGNTTASGTALINALAGISSPSSTNRWLLKIEPGIYDVGTTQLAMRSWVDIEGSGIGVTTIRGTVAPDNATIHGASDAELRLLTVEANPNTDGAAAMRNDSVSPRIYRVKFTATGGTYGVRNFGSAPLFEECEVNVTGTSGGIAAYGISYRGTLGSARSSILRTKITVTGPGANNGVSTRDGLFITDIRDSQITVFGGTESRGIYAFNGLTWSGTETLKVRTTDISAYSGSSASYGMDFGTGTSANIDITGSKVWWHVSTTTYGIRQDGSGSIGVQASSVTGFTNTVQTAGNASIASTYLQGGPATATGWIGCMGVWDENAVFYAGSTCP